MRSRVAIALGVAFAAAVCLVSVVLFSFYAEALRIHVLQPLIQAYYATCYYLEFVPQLILWFIPLSLVAAFILRQVLRVTRSGRSPMTLRASHENAPGEGELARLAHQIHRARHSRFARVRIARTLVEVGARLIAAREAVSVPQARRQLAAGYWRTAGIVHTFLIPRHHYTASQSAEAFEKSLQETIEHLEAFDQHG